MWLLEGVDYVLTKGYSSFYHHFLVQCLLENRLPISVCWIISKWILVLEKWSWNIFGESVYNYIHSWINGTDICKHSIIQKIFQVGFGMHCEYIFVPDLLSWLCSILDNVKVNLCSDIFYFRMVKIFWNLKQSPTRARLNEVMKAYLEFDWGYLTGKYILVYSSNRFLFSKDLHHCSSKQ